MRKDDHARISRIRAFGQEWCDAIERSLREDPPSLGGTLRASYPVRTKRRRVPEMLRVVREEA